MPLSDYERQVLGQIEAAASAGDPEWAEHMRWPRRFLRSAIPGARLRALAWVIVGFGMLTLGVTLASGAGAVLALAGYLVIVLWAVWLISAACARLHNRPRGHE